MTTSQKIKCHAIIHTTSLLASAVGAGLAQVPTSDYLLLTPLEVSMVTALGSIFGLKIEEGLAESLLASQIATMSGRAISQVLIGSIPVAGNIVNACTAAGIVQAMGWGIVADFSRKSSLALEMLTDTGEEEEDV